jgi:hypothetical protein
MPWLARYIHRIQVKGKGPRRSQEVPNFYSMPFLPDSAHNSAAGAPPASSSGTAVASTAVNENASLTTSLSDAAAIRLLLSGSSNASYPSSNSMTEAASIMSNLGIVTRGALPITCFRGFAPMARAPAPAAASRRAALPSVDHGAPWQQ